MPIINTLYKMVLDALFPMSKAEVELFEFTKEGAYAKLPPAPAPPIPDVESIFAYKDERVAKLVWNIKYNKSSQALNIGGYALYQKLIEKYRPFQPIVIAPMPITPRRRRERGFNQCELLALEMKKFDAGNQFTVRADLLLRTHHLSRQTLKSRGERLESAQGIFSVNEKVAGEITGATIIVIDDVITTGSTMKEAVGTIRKAGFKNVYGLSLAH